MATDARVRYTRKVIVENFIKLLITTPVKKITVKEICEMAEINRATFYKHYLDVYDLLEKIEDQFLEELKEVLSDRKGSTTRDLLTIVMVSLKAEEDTYKAVCSPNGDPSFPSKVFDICYQITGQQNRIHTESLSQVQQEWLYQFNAYGCNGILSNWIAGGMKEPISEVVDFTECLMNGSLAGLSQYKANPITKKVENIGDMRQWH